jgi:hypothetical protein
MIFYHIYGTVLNIRLEKTSENEKEDFTVHIKTAMDILCDLGDESPIKKKKIECHYGKQCKRKKCRFYHPD